jgi:hypothetical protein
MNLRWCVSTRAALCSVEPGRSPLWRFLILGFGGTRFALDVRIEHSPADEGKNEERAVLINPPDYETLGLANHPNGAGNVPSARPERIDQQTIPVFGLAALQQRCPIRGKILNRLVDERSVSGGSSGAEVVETVG